MHDQSTQETPPGKLPYTDDTETAPVEVDAGMDDSLPIKRSEQLDVERLVGAFKKIVTAGIDSWHTRAREQAKSTEKELEIEDRRHFRAAIILCYAPMLVVTLLWRGSLEEPGRTRSNHGHPVWGSAPESACDQFG